MGFFGFLFWLAILWLAFRVFRYWGWCGRRSRWDQGETRPRSSDQEYVDALESRVSQLEERLDFTERLVAGRREVAG